MPPCYAPSTLLAHHVVGGCSRLAGLQNRLKIREKSTCFALGCSCAILGPFLASVELLLGTLEPLVSRPWRLLSHSWPLLESQKWSQSGIFTKNTIFAIFDEFQIHSKHRRSHFCSVSFASSVCHMVNEHYTKCYTML